MNKLTSAKQVKAIVADYPQIQFYNGGKYTRDISSKVTEKSVGISRINYYTEAEIREICESLTIDSDQLQRELLKAHRKLDQAKTALLHQIENDDLGWTVENDVVSNAKEAQRAFRKIKVIESVR